MTTPVKNNVSYGDQVFSAEILPEGRPAIEHLARYLKDIPDSLNLSSPFNRCLQTVEIVTEITGKEFVADPRLNEIAAGKIELPHHFQKRVKSIYDEAQNSPFENVLICTHSAVLSALIKLITHSHWPWFMLKTIPPGVLIISEGKTMSQIDFNLLTSVPSPKNL